MLSRTQALTGDQFHVVEAGRCVLYRRSGTTKTWKTRPSEFRIPVMHGFRSPGQITDRTVSSYEVHLAGECPDGPAARSCGG